MPAIHVHPVSKQTFIITKLNLKNNRGMRALSAPIHGNVHVPSGMSEIPFVPRSVTIHNLKIWQENGFLYLDSQTDFVLTRERVDKLINHLEYLVKYTHSAASNSHQQLHDSFMFKLIDDCFVMHFCPSRPIPLFKEDLIYLIDFLECAYLSL